MGENAAAPRTLFLLVSEHLGTPEAIEAARPAHTTWALKRYIDGTFVIGGPQVPFGGAIVLAAAPSADDLRATLDTDPFVSGGLVHYDIREFVPVARTSTPDVLAGYGEPVTSLDFVPAYNPAAEQGRSPER